MRRSLPGGTNFSVFAKHSTAAQLLLFDHAEDARPSRVIDLDPYDNRTYHYWHVFVPGVAPGQIYGYRIAGPFDPARGLRFDPEKLLLDPYGKAHCPTAGAQPRRRPPAWRQRGNGAEKRRRRYRRLRLGGRRAARPAVRQDDHL